MLLNEDKCLDGAQPTIAVRVPPVPCTGMQRPPKVWAQIRRLQSSYSQSY